MGISLRAYARLRGVSDTAVRKAISTGRITTEPDGTIDPARADAEWAANTEGTPIGTRKGTTTVRAPRDFAATASAAAAPSSIAASSPGGGTSLLQARTVNEVVKAQTNKVRLARLKGELIDRAQAVAHVFVLARTERDAWLNWPARVSSQLAAQLGVDAHAMHIALENAVRDHLNELGELKPRFNNGSAEDD